VEQVRPAQPAGRFRCPGGLADATLAELWAWDEARFLREMEGSPIRRIGFERWRRNLAVAMGNALAARAPARKTWSAAAGRTPLGQRTGGRAHRLGPGAAGRA
jgi:epoxyqueuosine reductase